MLVFDAVLFAAVAVVLVAFRRPFAQIQSGVFGGRTMPGCVIAEAVVLLVIAVVLFLLRNQI